jgi:hypothetical protein
MTVGLNVDQLLKLLMMNQALQFCSNDMVNSAVASGSYKNTVEYKDNKIAIMNDLHQVFDK